MIYTSVHSMGNFYSDSKVCLYCVLRSCCVYPRALFLICGYTVPNSSQLERLLTIRVGLRHWLGFFFYHRKVVTIDQGYLLYIDAVYTDLHLWHSHNKETHERERKLVIWALDDLFEWEGINVL